MYEDLPTQPNLLGRVEHTAQFGALVTDFSLVRAGALHRANGGYLVLDARRLLTQPYAWEDLKRALRSGEIRIESVGERLGIVSTVSLEPEPIPLDLKVVLVGDRLVYYLLADLRSGLPRAVQGPGRLRRGRAAGRRDGARAHRAAGHASPRARACARSTASAAAALADHASRLAGDAERLSTHMRRLTDVLREADDRAARAGRAQIAVEDVTGAVEARRHRASRLHDLQLEHIERGTILVATDGEAVGVANGLSVILLGEEAFGRPSRITARVRLGDGEVVDIEREVELGGPIHSKGVLILSGFLGGRYGRDRPLSLAASLVFEQSYGGVEGDSATLAETCALLSAIGEVPLRQGVAITGSLNQQGEVQPVGAVNEKVEGFFDVCAGRGLTGEPGRHRARPRTSPNLMLRADVVDAAAAGRFSIWPVATVDEALEILTGLPAGDAIGRTATWTPGSVNARVVDGLERLGDRAVEALGRALEARDGKVGGGRRGRRPAQRAPHAGPAAGAAREEGLSRRPGDGPSPRPSACATSARLSMYRRSAGPLFTSAMPAMTSTVPSDPVERHRVAEHDRAQRDPDDRQQVRDHRGPGRAPVGEDREVAQVGDAGAQDAQPRDREQGVGRRADLRERVVHDERHRAR